MLQSTRYREAIRDWYQISQCNVKEAMSLYVFMFFLRERLSCFALNKKSKKWLFGENFPLNLKIQLKLSKY